MVSTGFRRLRATMFGARAIFLASTVGAIIGCGYFEDKEIGPSDRLYILFEDEIAPNVFSDSSGALVLEKRSLRKVKSVLHGYYFFYKARYLWHGQPVTVAVDGALLCTPKKSRAVFGQGMPSSSERLDLRAAYGVERAMLDISHRRFRLALLRGRAAYNIEVNGLEVSEESLRTRLMEKFGNLQERHLVAYSTRLP